MVQAIRIGLITRTVLILMNGYCSRMPDPSRDFGELLQRHGLRATPNRLLVLQELAHEPDDVTAQELWGRLREGRHTTGLATVYRTLALLNDAGVVDTLSHHAGGEQCYRLCSETHHH